MQPLLAVAASTPADRVALLRAVTDWYRVHMPLLLGQQCVSYFYRVYRAELGGADPRSPISASGFVMPSSGPPPRLSLSVLG